MSKYIAVDRKGNYRIFSQVPMKSNSYDGSAMISDWTQLIYPTLGTIISKEEGERLVGPMTHNDEPKELVNYDTEGNSN